MFDYTEKGERSAYGLVGSIISNITWSMGVHLQIELTKDGYYGSITPDGGFMGVYADLDSGVRKLLNFRLCESQLILNYLLFAY